MFPFWHKLVIARESLEHRSLANGYGTVLLGMSKSAVSESIELRRHGGGWLVPAHTPINAAVCLARIFAMALGNKSLWPISPSSTLSRGLDAPHVERRKRRTEMKSIIRIAFTRVQFGQITYDFPHRLYMYILGRRGHLYITKYRRYQNHSLPQLRQPVLWAFHYLMAHMVTKIMKCVRES